MALNLCEGVTLIDLRLFTEAVVELAWSHHMTGTKRFSGEAILNEIGGQFRIFHRKMATGIYNQARQTLELSDRNAD